MCDLIGIGSICCLRIADNEEVRSGTGLGCLECLEIGHLFTVADLINIFRIDLKTVNKSTVESYGIVGEIVCGAVHADKLACTVKYGKCAFTVFIISGFFSVEYNSCILACNRACHPGNTLGRFRIFGSIQLNIRRSSIFVAAGRIALSLHDEGKLTVLFGIKLELLNSTDIFIGIYLSVSVGNSDQLAGCCINIDTGRRETVQVFNDNICAFRTDRHDVTDKRIRRYTLRCNLAGEGFYILLVFIRSNKSKLTLGNSVCNSKSFGYIGRNVKDYLSNDVIALSERRCIFLNSLEVDCCFGAVIGCGSRKVIGIAGNNGKLIPICCKVRKNLNGYISTCNITDIIALDCKSVWLTENRCSDFGSKVYSCSFVFTVNSEVTGFGRCVTEFIGNGNLDVMLTVGKTGIVEIDFLVAFVDVALIGYINAVDCHFYFAEINTGCILAGNVGIGRSEGIDVGGQNGFVVNDFVLIGSYGTDDRIVDIIRVRTVNKLNIIKINGRSGSVTLLTAGLIRNPEHTAALIEAERSSCRTGTGIRRIGKVKFTILPTGPVTITD